MLYPYGTLYVLPYHCLLLQGYGENVTPILRLSGRRATCNCLPPIGKASMRRAAVWLALVLTFAGCACARQVELSVPLHSRTSRDVYKVKLRASSGRRARAPRASTGPGRSLLAEQPQPLPSSGSKDATVDQVEYCAREG